MQGKVKQELLLYGQSGLATRKKRILSADFVDSQLAVTSLTQHYGSESDHY